MTLRWVRLADLGGDRLQPGLVAIGQREVAAARGQFQRQRAADAAGGAGDGGGRPLKSQSSRGQTPLARVVANGQANLIRARAGFGNRTGAGVRLPRTGAP